MRTDRFRSRPLRVIVTWSCVRAPDRAAAMKSASSGKTSVKGRPSVSGSVRPISFSAERLRMLTQPSPSTPITPALAPASTASVNRRRLSIRSRARMISSRWLRNSCVMRLNVSPSCARSPSDWRTGTRTCRLPVETTLAAPIRRRIGATSRLAKSSPTQTADNSTVSAMTVYISANAICTPRRRASIAAYSLTLSRVACNCGTTRGSSSRVT